MPRRVRFIIPNLPHHALQRGNNKQKIFKCELDYRYFLKNLRQYSEENSVGVGAYCLMTNHIHLLVYPKNTEGLIQMMKLVLQKYSQYFNKKYKRTGKIWENRYKLNIVDSDAAWQVARYIDLNPVRAKIVSAADQYAYSSARYHISKTNDSSITKDVINGKFDEYCKFLQEEESANKNHLEFIRSAIQQQKALGKKTFLDKLKQEFNASFEIRGRGRPKKTKEK